MSSGKMRERVAIRRSTRTQLDDGSYTAVVAAVATVWAEVRAVQAAEKEQAGRLFGSTTYLVRIRADERPAGLTVDDTVRWETAPGGPVDFQLRAIRQAPGRELFLEFVCESGAVL